MQKIDHLTRIRFSQSYSSHYIRATHASCKKLVRDTFYHFAEDFRASEIKRSALMLSQSKSLTTSDSPHPIHNQQRSFADLGSGVWRKTGQELETFRVSLALFAESCAARVIASFVLSAGIDRSERKPITERFIDHHE
jgi:hypothetical protein